MKCTLFTLIALSISLVSAEIKISNPIGNTKWTFGKTETVQWSADPSDSGPKDLYVFYLNNVSEPTLFQGGDYVAKVAVEDVSSGSAKVDLSGVDTSKYPPTSNKYFIRIGDVDGGYSAQFTISGGTGKASTGASTGATGSGSTTSSAADAASGAKVGAGSTGATTGFGSGASTTGATSSINAGNSTSSNTVTSTSSVSGKLSSDATTKVAFSFMAIFVAFVALFL